MREVNSNESEIVTARDTGHLCNRISAESKLRLRMATTQFSNGEESDHCPENSIPFVEPKNHFRDPNMPRYGGTNIKDTQKSPLLKKLSTDSDSSTVGPAILNSEGGHDEMSINSDESHPSTADAETTVDFENDFRKLSMGLNQITDIQDGLEKLQLSQDSKTENLTSLKEDINSNYPDVVPSRMNIFKKYEEGTGLSNDVTSGDVDCFTSEDEEDDDDSDLIERGPIKFQNVTPRGKPYDMCRTESIFIHLERVLNNMSNEQTVVSYLEQFPASNTESDNGANNIDMSLYGESNYNWGSGVKIDNFEQTNSNRKSPTTYAGSSPDAFRSENSPSIPSIVLNDSSPGINLLQQVKNGTFQKAQELTVSDTSTGYSAPSSAANAEIWADSPNSTYNVRPDSRSSSFAHSPFSCVNLSPIGSPQIPTVYRVPQPLSSSSSSNLSYSNSHSPANYQSSVDPQIEKPLINDLELYLTSPKTILPTSDSIDYLDSNELKLVLEVMENQDGYANEMQIVPDSSHRTQTRTDATMSRENDQKQFEKMAKENAPPYDFPDITSGRQSHEQIANFQKKPSYTCQNYLTKHNPCGVTQDNDHYFPYNDFSYNESNPNNAIAEARAVLGQQNWDSHILNAGTTQTVVSDREETPATFAEGYTYYSPYSAPCLNISMVDNVNIPTDLMSPNKQQNISANTTNFECVPRDSAADGLPYYGQMGGSSSQSSYSELNTLLDLNNKYDTPNHNIPQNAPTSGIRNTIPNNITNPINNQPPFNEFQIPKPVSELKPLRRRSSLRNIAPWPSLYLPLTPASQRLKEGLNPEAVKKAMRNLLLTSTEELAKADGDGDTKLMCLVADPKVLEKKKAYLVPLVERLNNDRRSLSMMNSWGEDALYLAAMNCPRMPYVTGYLAATMLEKGIDITQKLYKNRGDTLIHSVAAKGDSHRDVLAELLALNTAQGNSAFDLSKCNYDGQTALHVAVEAHDPTRTGVSTIGIVRLLLDNGANPKVKMPTCGGTALHIAITRTCDPALVKALLYKNGDEAVNQSNYRRDTPVHLAAAVQRDVPLERQMRVCQWLIDAGGQTNIQNVQGKTPLALVAPERKQEIMKIFQKRV